MVPLVSFLYSMRGTQTDIYFVDSTDLEVCHIKRAKSNKIGRKKQEQNGMVLWVQIASYL
jgi:hypothetical protein